MCLINNSDLKEEVVHGYAKTTKTYTAACQVIPIECPAVLLHTEN